MALIKHANAAQIAREAIVLDLGDLTRQGQALIESARARADQILAEARIERDRLIAGAAEKGRAEGLAKGLDEGRAKGRDEGRAAALAEHRDDLARLAASWQGALDEFAAQRQMLLNHAHTDILKLAAMIAERVVKRAIELDAGVVADQVRAVLASVTRPTELLLRVHPEDLETAQAAMPELLSAFELVRGAEVIGDPSLSRGSCVASARSGAGGIGGGEVDASIGTQLDRIIEALLPGGGGATHDPACPEPAS
ncbi:MAG: hypothetical protein KF869_06210 [Phycisphaeraceae bacterium]|nr:hypothetical protein [Phycisphaeraceae bacterium]